MTTDAGELATALGLTIGGRVAIELNYGHPGGAGYDRSGLGITGVLTAIETSTDLARIGYIGLRVAEDTGADVIVPWHAIGRLTLRARPRHPAL